MKRARDRMIARHKLIEAMIRNNELQLKNESARGGAEIEHACALRDVALPGAGAEAAAELEKATAATAGHCKRSAIVSSPNANGSMRPCWNSKAGHRPTNTNARGMHDEQDGASD